MEPKQTKSLMVKTRTISGLGAAILSKVPNGAKEPTCEVWEHIKCKGIYMQRHVKGVEWLCESHREKPAKKIGSEENQTITV